MSWIIAAFIFISFLLGVICLLMVEEPNVETGAEHKVFCYIVSTFYFISYLVMIITTV